MNATLYIAVAASILAACALVVLWDEHGQNGAALDAARATRLRLISEISDLRAALAAAHAHLAEVVTMRDAAYDDLRTARISAIAACDDLRTARADRDRAIRAYQSAADAAATAEVIGRRFQQQRAEVLAELHDTRETLAVTTSALATANAALAHWEHTHIECDATICEIADERDAALAAAARWQRVAGNLTLADLCGSDRDDK